MSDDKKGTRIIEAFLGWIKTVIPLSIFSAITAHFRRKAWLAEQSKKQVELRLKTYENKETIEKQNEGRSDSDIVRDAIRSGKLIRSRKGKPSK